jgi:hypothetical protein
MRESDMFFICSMVMFAGDKFVPGITFAAVYILAKFVLKM